MLNIALFGGTFDPIHNGHLQTNFAVQNHLQFDSYYFIPCKISPLKPPALATDQQRITMLKLALANHPSFQIDLCEINRLSPSYTIETLRSYREKHKEASITLVIGYDSFLTLPQWYQWQEFMYLAHILVMKRPSNTNIKVPTVLEELLIEYHTTDKSALLTKKLGCIYQFNAGYYNISSTDIRNAFKNQDYHKLKTLVPETIFQYCQEQNLYNK